MGDENGSFENSVEFHQWKFRLALMSPKKLKKLNDKPMFRIPLKRKGFINLYSESSTRDYSGITAAYQNKKGWNVSALLDETCPLISEIGKRCAILASGTRTITSSAYPWLQIKRFTEPDWSDGLIWSFYGYFQNHEQFSHPFPRRRGREQGLIAPEVMDLAFELLSSDHPNLTRSGAVRCIYQSKKLQDEVFFKLRPKPNELEEDYVIRILQQSAPSRK